MSSLRRLGYEGFSDDASVLDGCTFKLNSFSCTYPYSESLQKFINSQLSNGIRNLQQFRTPTPFEETFLLNLTRVKAKPCWVRALIPGRPESEVMVDEPFQISFTTLPAETVTNGLGCWGKLEVATLLVPRFAAAVNILDRFAVVRPCVLVLEKPHHLVDWSHQVNYNTK
jgi:hypothetical protein